MADKNFTQFDLKTTLSLNDFLVGYVENGTNELRTKISDINSFILDKQTLSFNENNKNLTLSNGKFASLSSIDLTIIKGETYSSDADYFIQITDYNKLLTFDNINLTNVNVIINKDLNFPVGSEIRIMRKGDGNVALSASNGVNLRSVDNSTYIKYKNSVVNLVKLEENDWLLYGDLSKLAPAFTPTPTPTPTNTETPTPTPTETPTNTPTETPTNTPTPTNTETPTPTPTETPTNTPTPTPTPTPIPITNITINNSTVNVTDNQNYIVVDNDVVSTFTLTFDGVDGVTFTDVYDINDFNNCKLTITTTSDISANKDEVFVTSSLNLSTIQDKLFTFYYFNTGSLVLGASPANLPLVPPPPIVPPSAPTWTQVGASITVAFGSNIAMNHSGDRIIVGEGNDDRSKIFSWNGTSWNQMGNDINGQPNSAFGRCVVMNADGNLIAISSPLKGPNNTGAVKSYSWDGSSWIQFGQELVGNPDEYLGFHISMDDRNYPWLAAIGSNNSGNQGYVKTYEANGPQWYSNQQDIILSYYYRARTHLNGNSNPKRIAVGEPFLNLGGSNLNNSGAVTIYSKGNGVWNKIGQTLSGIAVNEYFGSNVVLNDAGDRLFITSRYYNNLTNENGRVYTYSWNNTTSTWVQLAPILTLNEPGSPREADKFCQEISINSAGNRMVLASDPYTYYDPSNGQILNGDVRTYQFNGSSWVKIGQTISYKWDPDFFGADRVAMNSVGDKIAICSTEDIKVYSLS